MTLRFCGIIGPTSVLVALLFCVPASARDLGAANAVGLFGQSCLSFTGNPSGLREWAARYHLPEGPPPTREGFLHGNHGRVYVASTVYGQMALVSLDKGYCQVVMRQGNVANVQTEFRDQLLARHATLNLLLQQQDPQRGAAQKIFAYEQGAVHLQLSITAHGISGPVAEVILTSTLLPESSDPPARSPAPAGNGS
ncbi:hypothetical protein JK217_07985 [Gluconobacter kondonii]|uniref:NMCC_0638 family (lipo)protein n=1 Tax=Gluconobacter kondonii TaxID=941463 RepID=UPI001B8D21FA|nr:hypothetical protein [Gluconobacter kondonii]MBS1077690.1 hypothetical protein [Gluconobacter kondonii]